MPNLVGTGLNQVPTNSMLGGLAYQDPEHASIKNLDLKNLSQINSEIADTAVDVFVYDTRKDSDGGAWRKRTLNTSWYNETLNTATRGSRKEFPSVAVIVAESNKVTIYDGDDPDLPMWMTFEPNGIIDWPTTNTTRINISALNGILTTVTNDGGHLFKFVEDFVEIMYSSANYNLTSGRTLADRNNPTSYVAVSNIALRVFKLVTYAMNDVAMTVLPNAPIDDSTGLPIPTIAVATNNGVSIIKDDGTVISTTSQPEKINTIEFTKDYGLNAHIDASTNANKALVYIDNINKIDGLAYNSYANWDGVLWQSRYASNVLTFLTPNAQSASYPVSDFVSMSGRSAAIGSNFSDGGLTILEKTEKGGDAGQGMVAFASTSYNTGWMHGDIKGAFLSDTDTTNATDSQKVNWNNGSDISGSYGGTTAASVTVVSNTAITITADAGGYAYYNVGFTPVSGKKYVAVLTGSNYSGSGPYGLSTGGGFSINMRRTSNGPVGPEVITSNGSVIPIFVANGLTVTVTLTIYELVEEDRSVNNNGLQVYGTVTKSVVATGAELVGYGPFSASNYLEHPYNSDLLFGTSDFCITGWHNSNSSNTSVYEDIVCFGNTGKVGFGSNEPGSWFIQTNKTHGWTLYYRNSGSTSHSGWTAYNAAGNFNDHSIVGTGNWYKITLVKIGDKIHSYTNDFYHGSQGVPSGSFTTSSNLSDMTLKIGWDGGTSYNYPSIYSKMALWRISKSAPSPEQVKKMYEDEKCLFQENAKATLYGSSDAVTALAFDDTTNLLHVGTSAGRSEFQGLCRINNTTDAVTTAISASNGLVAEQ